MNISGKLKWVFKPDSLIETRLPNRKRFRNWEDLTSVQNVLLSLNERRMQTDGQTALAPACWPNSNKSAAKCNKVLRNPWWWCWLATGATRQPMRNNLQWRKKKKVRLKGRPKHSWTKFLEYMLLKLICQLQLPCGHTFIITNDKYVALLHDSPVMRVFSIKLLSGCLTSSGQHFMTVIFKTVFCWRLQLPVQPRHPAGQLTRP